MVNWFDVGPGHLLCKRQVEQDAWQTSAVRLEKINRQRLTTIAAVNSLANRCNWNQDNADTSAENWLRKTDMQEKVSDSVERRVEIQQKEFRSGMELEWEILAYSPPYRYIAVPVRVTAHNVVIWKLLRAISRERIFQLRMHQKSFGFTRNRWRSSQRSDPTWILFGGRNEKLKKYGKKRTKGGERDKAPYLHFFSPLPALVPLAASVDWILSVTDVVNNKHCRLGWMNAGVGSCIVWMETNDSVHRVWQMRSDTVFKA